jgi:hypothetical protein
MAICGCRCGAKVETPRPVLFVNCEGCDERARRLLLAIARELRFGGYFARAEFLVCMAAGDERFMIQAFGTW